MPKLKATPALLRCASSASTARWTRVVMRPSGAAAAPEQRRRRQEERLRLWDRQRSNRNNSYSVVPLLYYKLSRIFEILNLGIFIFFDAAERTTIPDRLREPDSTTLWYLQIGPEVDKIR